MASGEPKLSKKVKARSPKQPATKSRDQQPNTGFIHEQGPGMAPVGMLSTPIQPQWDMNGGLFTNITKDYLFDKIPANPNTTASERYLLEDNTYWYPQNYSLNEHVQGSGPAVNLANQPEFPNAVFPNIDISDLDGKFLISLHIHN